MRIKKFKKNEYVLEEGIWVRNPFCEARPVDINSLTRGDQQMLLRNESENLRKPHLQMDDALDLHMENVVIVSDGYGWAERQLFLASLPSRSVKVIGVNGSLARWSMVGDAAPVKRTMTFYVVNNPYPECMAYLPRSHRYYPNIVASTRTNPKFLSEYRSQPYLYRPTPDADYSGFAAGDVNAVLDDYRNPVCAAVSLAAKRGAKRILLLCCDESFEDERPGAERMPNGLFQYPQQIKCQRVVDRQAYWLGAAGIRVGDCSSGVEMRNATYIKPEGIANFFDKDEDE